MPVRSYTFAVSKKPKLELIELETTTGLLAVLELVVPIGVADLGEVQALEVDRLPTLGPAHNWCLVEDFSQTRNELHVPIMKRLLFAEDTLPEEMQGGSPPLGVPTIVRVTALETR